MLSATQFLVLEKALSKERLSTYKNYVKNKTSESVNDNIVALYEWNSEIAGYFLELCNIYEVSLRNAIYRSIDAYDHYGIRQRQILRQSPKLREKVEELGRNTTDGKIISSLHFHFWEGFLKKFFFWNPRKPHNMPLLYAYRIISFENSNRDKDILFIIKVTKNLRVNIRNRICHHDPIFNKDLKKILKQVMWVFSKIDYDLYLVINNLYSNKIINLLNKKPI